MKNNQTKKDKYMVQTILLDDIINYFPKIANKSYKKAIMKIDIEGYEPFAFKSSKNLFSLIDIEIIFMEWGLFSKDVINNFFYI